MNNIKKLSVAVGMVALLGLALSLNAVGQSSTGTVPVNFGVGKYIRLSILQGPSIDFGVVVPGAGPFKKDNATVLAIQTNEKTNWALSVEKRVKQGDARAAEVLVIRPAATSGTSSAPQIPVSYEILDNATLAAIPAENYIIEVVYTATVR